MLQLVLVLSSFLNTLFLLHIYDLYSAFSHGHILWAVTTNDNGHLPDLLNPLPYQGSLRALMLRHFLLDLLGRKDLWITVIWYDPTMSALLNSLNVIKDLCVYFRKTKFPCLFSLRAPFNTRLGPRQEWKPNSKSPQSSKADHLLQMSCDGILNNSVALRCC